MLEETRTDSAECQVKYAGAAQLFTVSLLCVNSDDAKYSRWLYGVSTNEDWITMTYRTGVIDAYCQQAPVR